MLLTSGSFKPEYGGPAVSVPGLARGLANLGVNVTLWAEDGSAAPDDGAVSITSASGSLASVVEKTAPTLIHDNGLWRPYSRRLARIAGQIGVPRVVTLRGMLEPWAYKHRHWRKRVAWWLYQRKDLESAALIHATSEMEADNLSRFSLRTPVCVIPNGINLHNQPTHEKAEPRVILFLSRLHPKKGLPLLIEAFSQLNPENWRLRIAGPDETGCMVSLQTLVSELQMTSKVEFLGAVYGDEKDQLFVTSSVFVLPSYSENFGMVVTEALSHGVPVVTTTGTPWAILQDRECGWWVEPNVPAIRYALGNAICCSADTLARMGENGRNLVAEKYSWDIVARQVLSAYQEVLKS